MAENLFETDYDVTKKSKLKKFYESNKILIFSVILIFIISLGAFNYYLETIKKKKILLSENYLQAKIYLETGYKNEAINLLRELIFANDRTYSTLSFFLMLNRDLIGNYEEISSLFDHLLINNKYKEEEKNLLTYKKILFNSNFANETKLLEDSKLLLNKNTLWKPHVLLLLGDYFVSKNENLKATEFYTQILSINNLHKDLYDQAKLKLESISNDK